MKPAAWGLEWCLLFLFCVKFTATVEGFVGNWAKLEKILVGGVLEYGTRAFPGKIGGSQIEFDFFIRIKKKCKEENFKR